MTRYTLLALGLLVGSVTADEIPDSGSIKADEELLRTAEVKTDGASLLDLIKRRTLQDVDRKRLDGLVKQLADDDFETREKATEELIHLGVVGIPALQKATKSSDPEQAQRADRCLQSIDLRRRPALIGAAVRLLAVRKVDGSVETLLRYLPSASDSSEIDEIGQALRKLGVRGGNADPLLLQALSDKDPLKRGVAGQALARAGLGAREPSVRLLLRDGDVGVREKVALALVEAKDKEALPVLIDLLKEASGEQSGAIEEMLFCVAGEKAPDLITGSDADARAKRHEAWMGWWKVNGAKLSLDKFDPEKQQLGYTLLASYGPTATGSVKEIDRAGKTRWQIDNLSMPVDAQMLPGDRVLISEYQTRLVSERDLTGKVLWQYTANGLVVGARRLPNRHTLVTMRTGVVEVDQEGKELWRFNSARVCAACKLSDGSVAVATLTNQLIRLNAEGKQTSTTALGGTVMSLGGSLAAAPNGRVLVPLYNLNKVVELDAEGKQVWEASVQTPTAVQRLPGGRILVTSRLNRMALEIDRTGKTVWQHQADGTQLLKAMRR
jgi:HEAT repeat protein